MKKKKAKTIFLFLYSINGKGRLRERERERERSDEKAENKKRPDVDKFHVTVLRRSFVCEKISYLGSLSLKMFLSLKKGPFFLLLIL